MVAEVARRGEVRRPAVFVAAIAWNIFCRAENFAEKRAVRVVECEIENMEIVGAMLALGDAGADYNTGDASMVENPAGRDIGDGDAVSLADLLRRP